jgi:hypothetical protein
MKMADRTLTQIIKEVEQVSAQVASLELEIQSKREKLTALLNDQIELQSQTLQHFNMRLSLVNGATALPVASKRSYTRRKRAVAAVAASPGSERKRNAAARRWAEETNWRDSEGKAPNKRGPMPQELLQAFEAAQA